MSIYFSLGSRATLSPVVGPRSSASGRQKEGVAGTAAFLWLGQGSLLGNKWDQTCLDVSEQVGCIPQRSPWMRA